jgi:hypothetical protein
MLSTASIFRIRLFGPMRKRCIGFTLAVLSDKTPPIGRVACFLFEITQPALAELFQTALGKLEDVFAKLKTLAIV